MKQPYTLDAFQIPNGDLRELPSWVTDPDNPNAVSQCEHDMVAWFVHERTREMKITHEEAAALPEPERRRLIAEGAIRAIKVLGGSEEVQGRALHSLAFRMFKASAHVYDENEPETFIDFLLERLGHVKSAGAISETNYMMNLLASLEQRGVKIGNHFRDRKGFAKFSKAIPIIRARENQLTAAERHFQQTREEIKRHLRTAKTEKERENIEEQQQIIDTQADEIVAQLVGNLEDTIEKAIRLAKDSNVDAEQIPFFLSQIGNEEKPDGDKAKLPVPKMLLGNTTVYLIEIRNGHENIVERALQDFCEIFVEDPRTALERYKPYLA